MADVARTADGAAGAAAGAATDAAGIGARIRAQRLSVGLTQAQLGAPDWSPSYLSLIESGRRPAGEPMLGTLARRLGCSVQFLRSGEPDGEETRLAYELRAGELALRGGDADEAVARYESALAVATRLGRKADARLAGWGAARAREASGMLDDAIDAYEELRAAPATGGPPHPMRVTVALVRCYREAGDLAHAIALGEAVRTVPPDAVPDPGAEVELLSTIAGCYYERGDWARAGHLTRAASRLADALGERRSRGAAYWNASLIAETRGRLGEALALADQALALHAADDDARSVALLRVVQAWLLLRADPPETAAARAVLTEAEAALAGHGTEVERAYCETELARCDLLSGDPATARRTANRALERLGGRGRMESARVHLVLAQAELALGDRRAARDHHRRAAGELTRMGASRQAAAAWRELATSLELAGRLAEATAAYRAAMDSAGVAQPWPYPLPDPQAGERRVLSAT